MNFVFYDMRSHSSRSKNIAANTQKKMPLASVKFPYLTFVLRKSKIQWSTSGASIKYLSLASCDASCFTMWYLTSIAALHHKDNIKSSAGKKGFLYKYQKAFLFPLAWLCCAECCHCHKCVQCWLMYCNFTSLLQQWVKVSDPLLK